MTIDMKDDHLDSVTQLPAFIKTAESLGVDRMIRQNTKEEVYAWIQEHLTRLRYLHLRKKEKGIVRTFLRLYTGYSARHIETLVSTFRKTGVLALAPRTQTTFERVYTDEDVQLLATVAEAYQHQNGKALKQVLHDMYEMYRDVRFARLAYISVSRLYDLKQTETFKQNALTFTKTCPVHVPIGERKKPYPEGKPGYLRVDSVHQGDLEKEKGVYHINLVDEETQWEIVLCVEAISEYFLAPVLEEALLLFPFLIINFHSDNGSEYINKVVAGILGRLLISQTKSRARTSTDNALVEGKNGAVIRKYMGHRHIPKKHASAINTFYQTYFNPFLNFHRFCAFPETTVSTKGKVVKTYNTFLTPCGKLLNIPDVAQYLREGVTEEVLRAETKKENHLAFAQKVQKARETLFASFKEKSVV